MLECDDIPHIVLTRKKITGLPAFTTVRGGAYFFLLGLKALRCLANLNDGR